MNVDFRPIPLLGGAHVQTVFGTLLNYWVPGLPARQRVLRLPDGDALLLFDSRPRHWQPGGPIALLIHGLSSSHRAGNIVRLGRLLVRQNIRVVRMDLRGAGWGMRFARRTYTAASSDDVRAAAEEVLRWSPGSPLVLAGLSLGGNIVLKLAGEAGHRPLPGLAAVAAANPPIDLTACSVLLARPSNLFYTRYFARNLIRHVRLHRRIFRDLPTIDFPWPLTLREFDEIYTAPSWGFADAADYYRRGSALPHMEHINVPTLIVTARDDPFVDTEPIASLPRRPEREIRIAPHGGHLGFVGFSEGGYTRWVEPQLADWIVRTLAAGASIRR